VQAGQTEAPGSEQTTQRRGSSRSRSTWRDGRTHRRARLSRKWNKGVTSSAHGLAAATAAEEEAVPLGPDRPRPPVRELVGPMGRSACQEVAAAR
jgi:hypothetical protein